MSPKVYVLTTVFNDEKNIERSICSILSQSYKYFQYIIIDDGSTDKSKSIIKKTINKDNRTTFISFDKNRGSYYPRNYFLSNFNYDYLFFQDSDDVSQKNRIEEQLKYLQQNKDVIACGSFLKIVNEKNKIVGLRKYKLSDCDIRKQFMISCPVPTPSLVIRNLKKKLFFNSKYYPADDLDFLIKLNKYGKYGNVPKFLVNYKLREKSLTVSSMKKMELASIKIRYNLIRNKNFKKEYIDYITFIIFIFAFIFISSKIKLFIFKKVKFN